MVTMKVEEEENKKREEGVIVIEEIGMHLVGSFYCSHLILGDYIIQRYQDDDDKEQMMENMIMELQVMMEEARKQQDGNNNDSIVGIINIPEDVFMFHIVGYLNQKEVVSGLSETNKLYSTLMRNRYGIEIKMYPDEVFIRPPEERQNIINVRLITTV
jgi:hypothetical protein